MKFINYYLLLSNRLIIRGELTHICYQLISNKNEKINRITVDF